MMHDYTIQPCNGLTPLVPHNRGPGSFCPFALPSPAQLLIQQALSARTEGAARRALHFICASATPSACMAGRRRCRSLTFATSPTTAPPGAPSSRPRTRSRRWLDAELTRTRGWRRRFPGTCDCGCTSRVGEGCTAQPALSNIRTKRCNTQSFERFLAVLLGLVLAATGLWASAAEEEEPAAAMEKEMVMDPTTGKMVTAPEYGGTITYGWGGRVGEITDPFFNGLEAGWLINGVNERLGFANWGLDRDQFDLRDELVPLFAYTGNLAESWETPDPLTYVFHIRQGVRYALNPDSEASRFVNGRELTADDVVFTYQRNMGLGDFTERTERLGAAHKLPWASVDATDEYTVVMKMTEPVVGGLHTILESVQDYILPPEVIERYGDYKDWQNVVGTGPWMLTDYVEGASKTYIKNPDYYGFDEKYPDNRPALRRRDEGPLDARRGNTYLSAAHGQAGYSRKCWRRQHCQCRCHKEPPEDQP